MRSRKKKRGLHVWLSGCEITAITERLKRFSTHERTMEKTGWPCRSGGRGACPAAGLRFVTLPAQVLADACVGPKKAFATRIVRAIAGEPCGPYLAVQDARTRKYKRRLAKKIAPVVVSPHSAKWISPMTLELRRVILFTSRLAEMADFYSNVLGLQVTGREDGWVDFSAGACHLALHAGPSKVGTRPPKLAFYAADVSGAREALMKNGLVLAGPVKSTGNFDLCDCKDPDGNRFQLSSRS